MAGAKFRCRVLLAGLCIALLALAATNGRAQNPGTTTAPPAGADANGRATEKDQDRLKKMSLEELMKLDVATVTTASKKAEKATEAPGTVVVIDARDIQMRGYSNLKDVLRDLPGMETTEYFFSEFGTQVPVRGISGNNKIVVLVNGMRVNPPGGENFPFRSDFSVRAAERIEVIYGPGSTLYGQDAISAVINIITKQPTEGVHGEVGAGGGANLEREAWGSFGGVLDKNGKVKLSGYVQYHDSDLTRLDKEYPKWWKPFRDLAEPRGSGVVPARSDYGLNLFARLDVYDTSVQVWHRESSRSSSESGYPPAYVKQAVWEDNSTVVEGRNTLKLSEKVKLDSAVTYNRYEIDPSTRYVFNTPDLPNQWFLNDFKAGLGEGFTVEETVRADLHERFSLLGGISVGLFDITPKYTVNPAGFWQYSVGIDPTLIPLQQQVNVSYQTYAGYVEAGWKLVDRLKLIGGIRVTKDTRFNDIPLTPRAALIYDVSDHVTAKYIYTRAYVAPAPYFSYATYDNGSLLARSNPDVQPETAETHEINLSYNRKNLSLSLSGYYGTQNDIIAVSDSGLPQNIITTEAFLNGDPMQRRTLVHTVNGGDSTRYGFDLYGRATWGPVSLWASYSYVDFHEKDNGIITGLPGISKHNGRLGATWAITPDLFVTPSLVIRSTPANVPSDSLGSELSTPWQLDLYVLYNFSKHVSLFADFRNITDHHYALGGFGNGRTAIPMETFNCLVGLKASF